MRRPLRSIAAALTVLALVVTGLTGCSDEQDPKTTLEAFLTGWHNGKLDSIGFVTQDGANVAASDVISQIRQLSGELVDRPPVLKPTGTGTESGDVAEFSVTVDWTLPGDAHWTYLTNVRLSKAGGDGSWRVIWAPSVVHEDLEEGNRLLVSRVASERAPILDAEGQPIVTKRPVVVVGVQPNAVTDIKALVKALDAAFRRVKVSVDLTDLPSQVDHASPTAFVEVVTLRETDYLKIRDSIQPLDGTHFRREERQLAPTRAFARALIGTVDPVQKADLDARPNVYEIGDYAGHGGLQSRYEDRLRGTAGQRVIISAKPDGTESRNEIYRAEPKPGTPVKTTLDQRTQLAADAALAGTKRRSALVAIKVTSGAAIAVANGPDGGGENLAFTASVPPGSTFKMVSTLGLLDAGAVTLDGKVNCPRVFRVDGRTFKNANNFALGSVPFRTDFAKSCNTAFAALAPKLGDNGLAGTAATLGIGGNWDLGVDAFSGKVSAGGPAAERAAAAFGQGTTVVSPLTMASATAAVANGRWKQPTVLLNPVPASPAPDGEDLKATSVQALKTMMREVVTQGTATSLRDLPGGPVYGKTGTAEFDDNPAHTHAWFVGWQGDVAFAVFVEDGGSSTESALPIAERFLRGLNARS